MCDKIIIKLKRTTKKKLDSLLAKKGESYDDLVYRLLSKTEGTDE